MNTGEVQETPDSGRLHKPVFPIPLGEASIIQLALNVGQEEVRQDSPPMLGKMQPFQKADDDNDDQTDGNNLSWQSCIQK